MSSQQRSSILIWRRLGLVAIFLSGCAGSSNQTEIVPDSAKARRAVELAMESWKAGRPTGGVEPTEPRIQVIDSNRKPGQTLQGHEIVAETASSRERTFTLRLSLANPDEQISARFLVMGIDPVLVFRQEDYDLMMHWEHKMDPETELEIKEDPQPPSTDSGTQPDQQPTGGEDE